MMNYSRSSIVYRLASIFAFILVVSTVNSEMAQAQPVRQIGVLIVEQGKVKVRNATGQEKVYQEKGRQIAVFRGDVVQTAAATRAKVSFRDGQETISLYANSNFKVDQVDQAQSKFGLNIGKAFFKAVAGIRRGGFQVRTPTATIGIKGTEWVTGTDGLNTFVLTTEGVVSMVNPEFPNVEIEVSANQASVVPINKPPTKPVQVTQETQKEIIESEGVETFVESIDFGEPPASSDSNGEENGDNGESAPGKLDLSEVVEAVNAAQGAVSDSSDSASAAVESAEPIPVKINITR